MTWKMPAKLLVPLVFVFASSSLGITQQPAAKSPEELQWLRYNDSAEGAFDMDVPLGWQIQGGMYRFGYFDVRWMMGARSLDGKVIILINDVNAPPYVLPGPFTGREGQPYGQPQQMQMVVAQFQQAAPYARIYRQAPLRQYLQVHDALHGHLATFPAPNCRRVAAGERFRRLWDLQL